MQARRRLLARRFEERDAAADLRHGVGEEGGPGRLSASCSRRPRSATTAGSAASSTCSTCRTKRRAWCSGIRRAGRSGSRSSSTCAASTATTATRKCAARRSSTAACGRRSGHWENYRENMFTTESENRDYAVKPMNCPGHVLIFNQGLRSYRDLPLRYGEFGYLPPQRAVRRAARPHARARLHAGRRPYLLHRGPDPGRVRRLSPRCCRRSTGISASPRSIYKVATRPDKRIGADERLGQGRGGAARGAAGARGVRVPSLARRRRLLRPEDRVLPQGRHRPGLAVRHHAGRFLHAGAAGRRVRRRGQRAQGAGHAAPGDRRLAWSASSAF